MSDDGEASGLPVNKWLRYFLKESGDATECVARINSIKVVLISDWDSSSQCGSPNKEQHVRRTSV